MGPTNTEQIATANASDNSELSFCEMLVPNLGIGMGVPTRQCNRSREFRCKMADAGRFLAAEVSAMALVPPGTRGSSAYAFLHRARGLRYRRSGQTFKQFPIDKQTMEHVVHMHKKHTIL